MVFWIPFLSTATQHQPTDWLIITNVAPKVAVFWFSFLNIKFRWCLEAIFLNQVSTFKLSHSDYPIRLMAINLWALWQCTKREGGVFWSPFLSNAACLNYLTDLNELHTITIKWTWDRYRIYQLLVLFIYLETSICL